MGSCYSSERPIRIPSNLTRNPKEAAKKLSTKSSLKTVNYTTIKDKLLNNHKTSFKTRKKSSLKPSHSLNSTRPTSEYVDVCLNNSYKDAQLEQENDNHTPKLEYIISLYNDVNKSNQLIEYEEYDNSSLKLFDYLNNDDNLIFGDDTNKYYPFPTFDSLANIESIQFECKIFNRVANSSEMPSNSIQNHYQQVSSMSSVGGGGVPDSDSSSIMTYSNSNSPQSSSIPSLKNSVQSSKPATKLNRFGFKPGITSSIPINSVAVQSKEVKKPTQVSTSMPIQSTVLAKKIPTNLTSLHIEEPVEQTPNRIKSPTEKPSCQIGRLPLPSHSFASRPLAGNQNSNKIQQVSSSSTTSTSASSNTNDYNIDQSSSLSSLSSASSSFSNKNLIDTNNNNNHPKKTVQCIAKITKLTPPKISTKLPCKTASSPVKPALVSLASDSTTSTTSSSSVSPKLPKQYHQSNTTKSSLLLNNKRRLFNPYKQTNTSNNGSDALSKQNSGKSETVNANLNLAKPVDTSSHKDTPADTTIKSNLYLFKFEKKYQYLSTYQIVKKLRLTP